MIKLTEKGKRVYGDEKLTLYGLTLYYVGIYATECIIASNPTELKALLDMGLIEIE